MLSSIRVRGLPLYMPLEIFGKYIFVKRHENVLLAFQAYSFKMLGYAFGEKALHFHFTNKQTAPVGQSGEMKFLLLLLVVIRLTKALARVAPARRTTPQFDIAYQIYRLQHLQVYMLERLVFSRTCQISL